MFRRYDPINKSKRQSWLWIVLLGLVSLPL